MGRTSTGFRVAVESAGVPSSFVCVHCVSGGGGDGEEDVGSVRGTVWPFGDTCQKPLNNQGKGPVGRRKGPWARCLK